MPKYAHDRGAKKFHAATKVYVQSESMPGVIDDPTEGMLPWEVRNWIRKNFDGSEDLRTASEIVVRTVCLMAAKGEIEPLALIFTAPEEWGGEESRAWVTEQGQVKMLDGRERELPKWFFGITTGLAMDLWKVT